MTFSTVYQQLYPASVGCKVVRLEPHMGCLNTIEGSLPTPYGPVKVRLEKLAKGKVAAKISAPEQVKIDAAGYVVCRNF